MLPIYTVACLMRMFAVMVRIENCEGTQPAHGGAFYQAIIRFGSYGLRDAMPGTWPAGRTVSELLGYTLLELVGITTTIGVVIAVLCPLALPLFTLGCRLRTRNMAHPAATGKAWILHRRGIFPVFMLIGILGAFFMVVGLPYSLSSPVSVGVQVVVTAVISLATLPFIAGVLCRRARLGYRQTVAGLVCLKCKYTLGSGIAPPCPECGQQFPSAAEIRTAQLNRKARRLFQRLIAPFVVVLAVISAVPYTFEEAQAFRLHALLGQSDAGFESWSFSGMDGYRTILTPLDEWLRFSVFDGQDRLEVTINAIPVFDPSSTVEQRSPSEMNASGLIFVVMTRNLNLPDGPEMKIRAPARVSSFHYGVQYNWRPAWSNSRVALWSSAVAQFEPFPCPPMHVWTLRRAVDVEVRPLDAATQERLSAEFQSEVGAVLRSDFGPGARILRFGAF